MLERQSFQEYHADEANSQVLDPSYFIGILKRRALYFAIPFLLIATIGSLITLAWPARYLSEGTILISSQEIPTELVRPTVATLANDRIQLITQRIMTRDKLLAIAKKFQLSASWQARMSGTELVDFIRERTQIKTADDKLQSKNQQGRRKEAVAFVVGFNYENPQIAMRVANELVTMILNEDVRSRTEYARETTRFLGQEVKRLEGQVALIDAQISALTRSHPGTLTGKSQLDEAKEITMLRAELLIKSASYSDAHPDIRALKRKLEALEKSFAPTNAPTNAKTNAKTEESEKTTVAANASLPDLGSLEAQRLNLRDELNKANQKLSAARLGESLESGQHSERLEVIEQPSLPQKPTSPNKPKIFAGIFVLALMAGGGLVLAAEMLNQSIRRSADLFSIIDSHLIVSIPYISTHEEAQRKKNTIVITTGILAMIVLTGLVVLYFTLPPLDLLFEKVMRALFR